MSNTNSLGTLLPQSPCRKTTQLSPMMPCIENSGLGIVLAGTANQASSSATNSCVRKERTWLGHGYTGLIRRPSIPPTGDGGGNIIPKERKRETTTARIPREPGCIATQTPSNYPTYGPLLSTPKNLHYKRSNNRKIRQPLGFEHDDCTTPLYSARCPQSQWPRERRPVQKLGTNGMPSSTTSAHEFNNGHVRQRGHSSSSTPFTSQNLAAM